MRGPRIMHAFIHPGGGYHRGISPHRIKISRRELREGKLNSPLLWVFRVRLSASTNRNDEWWWIRPHEASTDAAFIRFHRHTPDYCDPSHRTTVSSDLEWLSESTGGVLGGGRSEDDLCVPRGPPEAAASLMAASCSSTCSLARGVSSHLGQEEGLSLMVEGVTWRIFATARRCDGRRKRGLKSSPLGGRTNYVKHLARMVRHPSRLMVCIHINIRKRGYWTARMSRSDSKGEYIRPETWGPRWHLTKFYSVMSWAWEHSGI